MSGAAAQYTTMTVNDICALAPMVNDLADDNCILFMWWVGSQPEEALKVMKAWGFKLKTMTGFTWVKQTSKGNDFFGMGFWTRSGSENCLIATRGKIKRVSASVRSVIHAPIEEHSTKPNVFREEIVRLMGDVPRIELFARQKALGWSSWGNEIKND